MGIVRMNMRIAELEQENKALRECISCEHVLDCNKHSTGKCLEFKEREKSDRNRNH